MVPAWPSTPIVLHTRALTLLLILSLASACSSGGPPPPPDNAAEASDLFHPDGCLVAFSPDDALRAATEAAAERWGAATGCRVEARRTGIPVRLVAGIERPDGSQAPGVTTDRALIEINARSRPAQRASSVLHEMGHALGGDHVEGGGILSGAKERVDVIDRAALDSVCSRLSCPAFSPEAS